MIVQCWIPGVDGMLFGVEYWPEDRKPHAGVVMVPGISQPTAETDYLNSRIARKLAASGVYVLLVDLRGHGDSPSSLDRVTLDTLREDIDCVLTYVTQMVSDCLFYVARGMMGVLGLEFMDKYSLRGVAGINPYCADPQQIKTLWQKVTGDLIDFSEYIEGSDVVDLYNICYIKAAYVEAIGADLANIRGQKISRVLYEGILSYDSLSILKKYADQALWLKYDATKEYGIGTHDFTLMDKPIRLLDYKEMRMRREVYWQHYSIEKMHDWIMERVGGCGL